LPDPNDILKAMRSAGEDFAKLADTIEGKLPGIAKALARAPRHLKPLVRDLKSADALTNQFLQSLDKVEDVIRSAADQSGRLVSSFKFIRTEAGKSARAVGEISDRMDKVGDSLKKRTNEFANLRKQQKKLAASGDMPDPTGGLGLGDRARVSGAAGDKEDTKKKLAEQAKEYWHELQTADHQLKDVQTSLKALGAVSKKSGVFDAKQASEYGTEVKAAVEHLRSASSLSDLDPISEAALGRAQAAAEAMENLGENASKEDIAKATNRLAVAQKKLRASGAGATTELAQEYMAFAHESAGLTGVSLKDEQKIADAVAKRRGAIKEMISGGMNPMLASATATVKMLKEMPGSIGAATSAAGGFAKELSGIQSWDAVGIAKAWIKIGDSIKRDRQEIMEFTAQAGTLSTMFQSGMSAGQITGEFEKLRTSMNNLMGSWGKTRQEVQASMKTLTEAGFSMSDLTGPTLEAGEGFFSLAKSGEYAMSGMQQIATISAITGKSMGDVANMAGQWRERMGVDITSVGNTYLELETAARRSGLAVGKFMDRIMASSSGFILMGGNMDEVAGSLSNLMGSMDLPPGMASDIAGSFMERLNKMTVDDAMMGMGLVGDAGAKVLQDGAKVWADQRANEAKKLGEDIAKLKTVGPEGDIGEYNKKLEKLKGEQAKAAGDAATYSRLLAEAAKGDATSMSLLLQEEARRGHATAQELAILEDLSAMGVDVNKVVNDQRGHAIAGYEELKKLDSTAKGRLILEKRAAEKGYASYKEMMKVSEAMANQAKTQQTFAKVISGGNKEVEDAILLAVKTKDTGALKDALKGLDESELADKLLKINEEGGHVGQRVFDELQAVEGDIEKSREIVAKAMTKDIKGPKIETMAEEAARLAREQLEAQKKIEEYLNAIQKYMVPLMTVLMAIRLAQDIGMLKNAGAMGKVGELFTKGGTKVGAGFKFLGGKLGTLGKFLGGKLGTLGKFLGGKLPAVGKLLRTAGGAAGGALKTAGGAVGGVVQKAAGALSGVGLKGLASIAGKVAAPLALAAASYGLIKGITRMSDVYKDAKEKALKAGKTEAQARKIAMDNLKSMDSAKDVISTGLSYIMGDWLAGKLTGMLTWIPGFESVWADVVDAAMVVADAFAAYWAMMKPVYAALWKAVKVVAGYLLKGLVLPIRLAYAAIKPLVKILYQFGKLLAALFTGDFSAVGDILASMGAAIMDGIKDFWDVIADTAGALPGLFWNGIKALPGLFWKALKALPELWWKLVKAVWWDLPKWILGLFVDLLGWLRQKWQDLIDALNPVKKAKEAAKAVAATPGNIMTLLKAPGQRRDRQRQMKEQEDYASKMSPEAKKRLAAMREARRTGAPMPGPLEIGGEPAPPPPGVASPDLGATAGQLATAQAAKAAGTSTKAGVTDNSQWQVHINTRSEKEIEQAMLKTLQKHQQKLAN